jgi:hypothetical protein
VIVKITGVQASGPPTRSSSSRSAEVAQLQSLLQRCIRGLEDQVKAARPAKPAARSRQKKRKKKNARRVS